MRILFINEIFSRAWLNEFLLFESTYPIVNHYINNELREFERINGPPFI